MLLSIPWDTKDIKLICTSKQDVSQYTLGYSGTQDLVISVVIVLAFHHTIRQNIIISPQGD